MIIRGGSRNQQWGGGSAEPPEAARVMASAKREPIRESEGGALSGVQGGRSPPEAEKNL